MKAQEILKYEKKCYEEHIPPCGAGCPLHLDVRKFLNLVKSDNLKEAGDILLKTQYFPRILALTCSGNCKNYCNRAKVDEPIQINEVEKQFVLNFPLEPINIVPFMQMNGKVAIIGAGLVGLTAAYFLYEKGFNVTIFEKEEILGGKITKNNQIPQDLLDLDLYPITNSSITINTGNFLELNDIKSTINGNKSEFNAIIIAYDYTEKLNIDEFHQTEDEAIFALKRKEKYTSAEAVASGRSLGISVDRYLKGVSISAARKAETSYESQLYTNTEDIKPTEKIEINNLETAQKEANKCIDCHCKECIKECILLAKHEKYPKKYVREISNSVSMLQGLRSMKNFIISCSQCGLCESLCPNGLSMAEVTRGARQEMERRHEMPPRVFDYPIRDMEFSNSDEFQLIRHQKGTSTSDYLFFPGCQQAATMPEYILPTYQKLQEKLKGNIGIYLGCCGAPAHWSGRDELKKENMDDIIMTWEYFNKPKMIVACTTCFEQFTKACPEMELHLVWEYFVDEMPAKGSGKLAIADPCTARHMTKTQEDIRQIVTNCGYEIEELKYSKDKTKCCSYGGLMIYGNQELAHAHIEQKITETPVKYLCYCDVCRDFYASHGKESLHVLDLIFGNENPRPAIGLSAKKANRIKLKEQLILALYGEEFKVNKKEFSDIDIKIDDETLAKIHGRLITLDDLKMVIYNAKTTGSRLYNSQKGCYIASLQPFIITYWVEYVEDGEAYIVKNAYSHRLQILED